MLANYCELPNILPAKKMTKKQKLPQYGRTYLPGFQKAILEAKTVGDIVKAYCKIGASHGIHSDMPQECWAKIEAAKKSKETV